MVASTRKAGCLGDDRPHPAGGSPLGVDSPLDAGLQLSADLLLSRARSIAMASMQHLASCQEQAWDARRTATTYSCADLTVNGRVAIRPLAHGEAGGQLQVHT